jgi:hypothetical protein
MNKSTTIHKSSGYFQSDGWNMKVNGQNEDLTWLIK